MARECRRRGFSLMELVLTTAVISIVIVALGSAIVLTSRAMPSSAASGGEAEYKRATALEQMCAELRCATAFSEVTPTAVTFSVPDRDKDGKAEDIRYAWSGTPGGALTRQYNGGTTVSVADDL